MPTSTFQSMWRISPGWAAFWTGRRISSELYPSGYRQRPVPSRVTRVLNGYLRRLGIQFVMYLDDWLVLAESPAQVSQDTATALDWSRSTGWLVNSARSALVPSQQIVFLGARIDLVEGRAIPTAERIEAVIAGIILLQESSSLPARAWLVLLGYLASLVDLVPWCRLYMRPIQLHLLAFFRPASHSLAQPVPGAPHLREVFRWWLDRSNLRRGVVFPTPQPTAVITTDASLAGWGAALGTAALAHQWEGGAVRSWHINALELLAVARALQGFEQQLRGQVVLVRSDNTTTVAHINRQGGTRSLRLWQITWDMLQWCRERNIHLRATHLPGELNSVADYLSRAFQGHSEWSLLPSVTALIFQKLGTPEVDLFASPLNHKLPQFCTRIPTQGAWTTDALSSDWSYLEGYAFPPFALVNRTLIKAESEGCRLVLVAPFWPSLTWFPRLLSLLAGTPLILPTPRDLLSHPPGQGFHPHPEVLHLTAWKLSSRPSERRDFRRRLPRWQPREGVITRYDCILRDSDCFENGVAIARFLRPRLLFPQSPNS